MHRTDADAEDRDWFPDIAGERRLAWYPAGRLANHRDESFILQYLSPALMRKLRLFVLKDQSNESYYQVASIHDERGYEKIRAALAHNFDISANQPNIQVVDVDLLGDRHLRLRHTIHDGVVLSDGGRDATLRHVRRLSGYKSSGREIMRDRASSASGVRR